MGVTFDGNGSTIKTLTTGTPSRAHWKVRGGDGVTFTDMTLRGELDAETCPDAISSCSWPRQPTNLEWQHGWHFEGAVNSTLDRVAVYDVFGDFVGVNHDERICACEPAFFTPAKNISVLNSTFSRAGRMGIAITNIDGFLLQNSHLSEVNMAAIDLELDSARATGKNIRILNNTFGRHRFAMFSNGGQGEHETDIVIDGNFQVGDTVTCQPIVSLNVPRPGIQRTNYTITNNVFRSHGEFVNLNGITGAVIKHNTATHIVGGGCGAGGVATVDSHNITITDNAFKDHNVVVHRSGAASTGIVDERNTL
ncbi:MAG TPA: hypothetical protein VNB94_02965 [Mycobacteriales bacterium]|nr:hypothetical protein [Mycobacteriales bacterium]